MEHQLKSWPAHFEPVVAGVKLAEVRKADRPFSVGDTLTLREWIPTRAVYTGRTVSKRIGHIADLDEWASGFVLLSFEADEE